VSQVERDWDAALVENYQWEKRRQVDREEALLAAWEASRTMPTLVEFLQECRAGSRVLGPEGRVLTVEEHGWYRVSNKVGQTNHRSLSVSSALEALQSGMVD
jgi:hypothetical protein